MKPYVFLAQGGEGFAARLVGDGVAFGVLAQMFGHGFRRLVVGVVAHVPEAFHALAEDGVVNLGGAIQTRIEFLLVGSRGANRNFEDEGRSGATGHGKDSML